MRGVLPELEPAFPMLHRLPAVFQDDEFLARFLTGFDEALAPIFLTLDTLDCYVNPRLAPPDFLDWLAHWVGIETEEDWSEAERRELIANAVQMHRRRGTAAGIAEAVRLAIDAEVTVTESGAADWSETPGGELPGTARPQLRLTVRPRAGSPIDRQRLEAVVAAVKPAHVPHTIDVVEE